MAKITISKSGGKKSLPAGKKFLIFRISNFRFSWIYALIFALLAAAIILSLPIILRHIDGNPYLPGEHSYYNARIAQAYSKDNQIITYDPLSYGGRPYVFDPYPIALSSLSRLVGIESASRTLPFMLGIFSVLLLFMILKSLNVNPKHSFLAVVIFICSPLYIDTFSKSKSAGFAIFLFLLGSYLFISENLFIASLSTIIFLVMPLFGVAHAASAILILLAYSISFRKIKRYLAVFIPVTLLSAVYLILLNLTLTSEAPGFAQTSFVSSFFAGIGSAAGISIFVIILSVQSIFITWPKKERFWPVYTIIAVLSLLVLLNKDFVLYANIAICALSVLAFFHLIKSRWEIKLLKKMTLLVLVCGILFSAINNVATISKAEPSVKTVAALSWLGQNRYSIGLAEGTMLSHYSNGVWIEYFTGMPSFMDSKFEFAPNPNGRYEISEEIFQSRDLKTVVSLLSQNNIRYIFIDEKMKEGLVWKRPDQGMLLLLKNNETFKNIYDQDNMEIWEVISFG
ncbi:MAG: hypothetical protein QS98_C0014G0012 [archaeon GW2011_AR3]|nr:MAG: hypothetical protein QS98_C0014G0012 [archaeon GW2011_AR3]MBS3109267.1 hypothetical protein [Candidatus Woesearchaeota archaeon]